MKVIKRQIIGFFSLVKWITSNTAVEKWLLRGEGCVRRMESVSERKTKGKTVFKREDETEGEELKQEHRELYCENTKTSHVYFFLCVITSKGPWRENLCENI